MKILYSLLLIISVAFLISCDPDKGIQEIELSLQTNPFDRIRLESSSDIRIIQSNDYKVVISGLERDVNDVEVRVVDDRLTIEEHHHNAEVLIQVFVPEISELECLGSSQVYGESYFTQDRNIDIALLGSGELDFAIDTDNVDLELSGSGYAYLEGDVHTLDVEIIGSGWLRSFDLISDITDVRIEGSGSAEVNVVTDLDVFIIGSGSVFFKGHPSIESHISGSGSVIDAN